MKRQNILILSIILFFVMLYSFFIFLGGENKNKKTFNSLKSQIETIKNEENNQKKYNTLEDIEKQRQEEKIIEQENIKIFNEVGATGDTSLCLKIKDSIKKQECLDNGNLTKASFENNLEYCLLVKDQINKENCLDNYYYNQAINNNNSKYCDKIKKSSLKETCNADFILTQVENQNFSGNKSICSKLTGDDKVYCESKVENSSDLNIFNKAIEENKIELCKTIKDTELSKSCFDTLNLQLAISSENISTCNLIEDTQKKETCINTLSKIGDQENFKDAINKLDLKKCEKIINNLLKTQCIDNINFKLAINNKDEKKCNDIKSPDLIFQCREFFEMLKNQNN